MRESLQLGVLLLESRDEGEFLLDGLFLGERGGLVARLALDARFAPVAER